MNEQLKKQDSILFKLLEKERTRQQDSLDMVASESLQDTLSLALSGSDFACKTTVGLPGNQRLSGSGVIDELEKLAAARACELFGADHANILPYSGTTANLCVFEGLLAPGDTVLALDPKHGSHASHGRKAHITSKMYHFRHFGVDPVTQRIDYDALQKTAEESRPKMILAGSSSYPRHFDFARLADIAHNVGAVLMVDMAHTTGLTVAGVVPSPVPYADVVTASCTKTMCGVHTGFILCKKEYADAVDRGTYPGVLASMHPQTIAAAAWAFRKASSPQFRSCMKQILRNTSALADALTDRGLSLLTGGTDCHMLVLDLTKSRTDGVRVSEILGEMGIWVNSKNIPYDTVTCARGIRAGCTVVTQRGMREEDMSVLAELFTDAVCFGEEGYTRNQMQSCREYVRDLCTRHPIPGNDIDLPGGI